MIPAPAAPAAPRPQSNWGQRTAWGQGGWGKKQKQSTINNYFGGTQPRPVPAQQVPQQPIPQPMPQPKQAAITDYFQTPQQIAEGQMSEPVVDIGERDENGFLA